MTASGGRSSHAPLPSYLLDYTKVQLIGHLLHEIQKQNYKLYHLDTREQWLKVVEKEYKVI